MREGLCKEEKTSHYSPNFSLHAPDPDSKSFTDLYANVPPYYVENGVFCSPCQITAARERGNRRHWEIQIIRFETKSMA